MRAGEEEFQLKWSRLEINRLMFASCHRAKKLFLPQAGGRCQVGSVNARTGCQDLVLSRLNFPLSLFTKSIFHRLIGSIACYIVVKDINKKEITMVATPSPGQAEVILVGCGCPLRGKNSFHRRN